jgi:hypothetical protein
MKSAVFWDITPCSPLKANLCFIWLHVVMSQKTEHLITTAARTSVPTQPSNDYLPHIYPSEREYEAESIEMCWYVGYVVKRRRLVIFILL